MKIPDVSKPVGTLIGCAVCLAILTGMMVGHAWPLWTGEMVVLRARPVDPRSLFRGEFVRLDTPATRLFVAGEPRTPAPGAIPVRGRGFWERYSTTTDTHYGGRGLDVYVQLERRPSGEHEPVGISDTPVDGAVNLRGRVRRSDASGTIFVDYGLDAYYMQEGTAMPVEQALVTGRLVQMEVAVAASGRSRIRRLLVDGVPVR